MSAPFDPPGRHSLSTISATTDGPPLPSSGDEGYGLNFVNDVWFRWPASCAGVVTVSLCESDCDTRLTVYTDEGD